MIMGETSVVIRIMGVVALIGLLTGNHVPEGHDTVGRGEAMYVSR
jgi:hypothetical protein